MSQTSTTTLALRLEQLNGELKDLYRRSQILDWITDEAISSYQYHNTTGMKPLGDPKMNVKAAENILWYHGGIEEAITLQEKRKRL